MVLSPNFLQEESSFFYLARAREEEVAGGVQPISPEVEFARDGPFPRRKGWNFIRLLPWIEFLEDGKKLFFAFSGIGDSFFSLVHPLVLRKNFDDDAAVLWLVMDVW